MISIESYKLFAKYLVKGKEVLAYALGYSKNQAEEHLWRVQRIDSDVLDKTFNKKIIAKITNNNNYSLYLGMYKFSRVYDILLDLEIGETISYKELAKRSGLSIVHTIRALKHNPFPILVPCHRVIRSDGKLSGYTPLGSKFKELLLEVERNSRYYKISQNK